MLHFNPVLFQIRKFPEFRKIHCLNKQMESIEEGEKKPPSWEPSQDPSGAIPIPVKQLAAILLSGFVKVVLMCITLLNFPFFFGFPL